MRYTKPPFTFEEQADLLISRGLKTDRDPLIARLESTSYFRLSGYLFPFREGHSDQFRPETTLDNVWNLCLFDQRLRTLLIDAIEAIEVFTRTQLAHHFALQFDPFAYNQHAHLPNLNHSKFQNWQRRLDDQTQRSHRAREEFVVHFFNRYGDEHTRLPIWSLIELMDFGTTLTFYRGINDGVKKKLAKHVGVPDAVLTSWLLTLNTVRNRCAHHSRLWNWKTGTPVKLPFPRKYPEWHQPPLDNQRIGIVLTLCRHLLNEISPSNSWSDRTFALFDEFPDVPLAPLGLPANWRSHPLWN